MPATLRPSTSTSFGCLIDAAGPIAPATASAATSVSSGQRATGGGGQQRRPRRASPTRARRPRCVRAGRGPRSGARRARPRRAPRPGGSIRWVVAVSARVVVLAAEAPRSARQDDVGTAAASGTRVGRAVQPPPRRNRPIVRDLRPDRPLVYERLSDPILVTTCEGRRPTRPRGALRAARGPRSSGSRSTCSATPRTRATPPRSRSSKLVRARPPVPRRVAVLDLAAPARRQHVQGRRAGALAPRGGPSRCSRTRASRATATRSRRSPPPRRAASSAAASPSCPPPRRPSSRSRTRSTSFAEISAATGLPVGTAKCYAHRGRSSAARAALRMSAPLLGQGEIEAILPHRDPLLLIDEVLELVPGERVVARKTVTEEDCAGHFPGNPIMPGVKMVEALAQCGAVAVLSQPENRGKLALFAGIDDVRFKRIVRPGDVLDARVRGRDRARPGRPRQGAGDGRRRARRARHADLRGRSGAKHVIGRTNGRPISITGLGCHVPERVLTNDELVDARRHERRVDRRAHRHPRAADRARRRGADRHRAAGVPARARDGGRRGEATSTC